MSGKRKALCAVLTLLTSALIVWIFSNSLKDAAESSAQSGAVLAAVQRVLDALFAGKIVVSSHFIRKLAHFSEYALLGAMLFFTARAYGATRRKWVFPALIAALVPFLDEGLQFFSEGRAPLLTDVAIDLAGGACGMLFALAVLFFFGRAAGKRKKGKGEKREEKEGGSD